MKKVKEQNTSFFNLSNVITFISIFTAICAAIYFMEDRYNQKAVFEDFSYRIEAVNIRLEIYTNEQYLLDAQSRFTLCNEVLMNPESFKSVSKQQIDSCIKDRNTLPPKINQIEERIKVLIKEEMENDRRLHK